MFDRLERFLASYDWYAVALEMAIIWIGVYLVFRFLRGTRGAGVIKGFAVLLVAATLIILLVGRIGDTFDRVTFIYERFLGLLAIVLVVVFQPELRQAMIRLGHARPFRGSRGQVVQVVDAVSDAVEFLSKSQFGALIAIERSVKLGGLVEGGQRLDAEVNSRLLVSIFWPNNPLHDLGVVIRGNRIVAANVQFPLAEEGSLPHSFGSRHRAAAGISLESDCVTVIVSEETGAVSIAERGHLETVPREEFRAILAERLRARPESPTADEPPADEPDEDPDDVAGEDSLKTSSSDPGDVPRSLAS